MKIERVERIRIMPYPSFCFICVRDFQDGKTFSEHLVTDHGLKSARSKSSFNCLVCEQESGSHYNFKQHVINCHAPRMYRCNLCKKSFPRHFNLLMHKVKFHGLAHPKNEHGRKVKNYSESSTCLCNICGEKIGCEGDMFAHVANRHPQVIKIQFNSFTKRHDKNFMPSQIQPAKDLDLDQMDRLADMFQQAADIVNDKSKNRKCQICFKPFATDELLKLHSFFRHGHPCLKCDMFFSSERERTVHMSLAHF